jgi:hypothetical protein
MPVEAEAAVRAWINANTALVDPDGNDDERPLARGAYLRSQRSPADGPYVVLARTPPGGGEAPVAEPAPELDVARFTFQVYAGTEDAAEHGAVALLKALGGLTGNPVPAGGTGIWILTHGLITGPTFIPAPASSGEQYCFMVTADLLLADYGTAAEPYDPEEY